MNYINVGTILKVPTALVHPGCYNENTMSWVAHNSISHSSGGKKFKIRETTRSGLVRALFLAVNFLLCPHMVEGARELSQAVLIIFFKKNLFI